MRSISERYYDKVDQTAGGGGCHPWTASTKGAAGHEYGQFIINKKNTSAHRMSWQLTHGAIPPGMVVMHLCDNRLCCNPQHLRLGTHAENSADMVSKGRQCSGERRPQARLTLPIAQDIRAAHQNGETIASLARRLGRGRGTIRAVIEGRTWKR